MKNKKVLSVLMSVVITIFMLTGVSANAGLGINPNEVTYTLNQLLDMSDEEFLSLENSLIPGGAQGVYNYVEKHSRGDYLIQIESPYYNKIGGYFILDTLRDYYYKANYTEILIHELLADSPLEYSEFSPINASEDTYYWWFYNIRFPELGLEETDGIKNLPEATDENIMKVAKVYYCLQQACPEFGWSNGLPIVSGISEPIINGDVNLDKTVDLYDAIWIASHLINMLTLTESQQKIADVNADGVCDLYDAIEIAKTLLPE